MLFFTFLVCNVDNVAKSLILLELNKWSHEVWHLIHSHHSTVGLVGTVFCSAHNELLATLSLPVFVRLPCHHWTELDALDGFSREGEHLLGLLFGMTHVKLVDGVV